jgi:hypothetical protein
MVMNLSETYSVRFKVLITINIKINLTWDIILCSFVDPNLYFRGT